MSLVTMGTWGLGNGVDDGQVNRSWRWWLDDAAASRLAYLVLPREDEEAVQHAVANVTDGGILALLWE